MAPAVHPGRAVAIEQTNHRQARCRRRERVMTRRLPTVVFILVMALTLLGGPLGASADILPAPLTPTIGVSMGGTTEYTYNVIVTANQILNSGDFFVIYDFGAATL